jgi:hypothetical protein
VGTTRELKEQERHRAEGPCSVRFHEATVRGPVPPWTAVIHGTNRPLGQSSHSPGGQGSDYSSRPCSARRQTLPPSHSCSHLPQASLGPSLLHPPIPQTWVPSRVGSAPTDLSPGRLSTAAWLQPATTWQPELHASSPISTALAFTGNARHQPQGPVPRASSCAALVWI